MRRNNRKKINSSDSLNTILYVTGAIFLLTLIVFGITFVTYSNRNSMKESDSEYLAQFETSSIENTTSASTSIGKKIEDSKEKINEEETNTNVKIYKNNVEESKLSNNSSSTSNNKKTNENQKVKAQLKFEKPTEGEIIKEFTQNNLVYSETLKEWITHYGIDISGERGTEVKAAEDGKVQSIKNDPRYGLTIIIEHENGYKTLYSNLLTTEFVSEGQKVTKGQVIASIGDSAAYEIVDEAHLHFEIIKNGENINPQEVIEF